MRTLGIVPARAGSKRILDKNLRTVAGRTLLDRALAAATSARTLSCICVSSDDPRVLTFALGVAGVVAIERPAALAQDRSLAVEYALHALESFALKGTVFDAVAIIQPSSPFTLPCDIDETLKILDQ